MLCSGRDIAGRIGLVEHMSDLEVGFLFFGFIVGFEEEFSAVGGAVHQIAWVGVLPEVSVSVDGPEFVGLEHSSDV